MSVLIKVSRFGAQDRLFYFRSLMVTVGETAHGFLSSTDLKHLFFSVGTIEGRAILQVHSDEFSLDGVRLETGTQRFIESGNVLRGHDYQFTIMMTKPTSELAARLAADSAQEWIGTIPDIRLPQLRFQLAQWSKSVPLLEGIPLSAGSSVDDAIFLDLPGVQSNHLQLANDGGEVTLTARAGVLRAAGGELSKTITVRTSQVVTLEPAGITLHIDFPSSL